MVNIRLTCCSEQGKMWISAGLPGGIGGLVGQKRHSGIYRGFLGRFAGILEICQGLAEDQKYPDCSSWGRDAVPLSSGAPWAAENFCLIIYLRQQGLGCREIIRKVGTRHLRIEGTGINKISGKQNVCLRVKKRN